VTWVFRVLVLTGPALAFALTRTICHAVEARRGDEAEHGIETGRIVMTPEGGFTEIHGQTSQPADAAAHAAPSTRPPSGLGSGESPAESSAGERERRAVDGGWHRLTGRIWS
jgi:hypothetical protein